MTTAQAIIRAAIPNADDRDCIFILWERTAFPFEKLDARKLFGAASRWRRAVENKRVLCDHCDRIADADEFTCKPCAAALGRFRAEAV